VARPNATESAILNELQALRAGVTRTTEMFGDLVLDRADDTPAASSQTEDGRSVFEKVRQYFESFGNKPSTTTEIRKGAGVNRGALSNLIYTTHTRYFASYDQPGTTRRLWALRTAVAESEEFAKLPAHECCRRLLMDRGNVPAHVLTLAKEAVRRGYRGKGKNEGDALVWVTAKSFWARMSAGPFGRDFEQTEPNVFRLKNPGETPAGKSSLFRDDDEELAEDTADHAEETP